MIEGDDSSDYAVGLLQRVVQVRRERDSPSAEVERVVCHQLEHVGRPRDVVAHRRQWKAAVDCVEQRELFRVIAHECRQSPQRGAALARRPQRPVALSGMCSRHDPVDIFAAAVGHLGQHVAGTRILHVVDAMALQSCDTERERPRSHDCTACVVYHSSPP